MKYISPKNLNPEDKQKIVGDIEEYVGYIGSAFLENRLKGVKLKKKLLFIYFGSALAFHLKITAEFENQC